MKKHRGMGILSIIFLLALFIGGAIVGMKMVPAYLEYIAIKKAFRSMSGQLDGASVKDIKTKFANHTTIDDIRSIGPNDLEISKEGGKVVVSAAYQVTIPLFANISLLLDFNPTTQEQ
ncbi:MAG: DUF4845 domain-containing protein [Burkholderiales bacterium]